MLETLSAFPADPILKLMGELQNDPRSNTVDLGVGVYRTEEGATPVLEAVKRAEARILESEMTKTYVGPAGNLGYNKAISELILGAEHSVLRDNRSRTIQAPGGCGALKAIADLIARSKPGATIHVSQPTWANHEAIFSGAGLNIEFYSYYDKQRSALLFDAMLEDLKQAKAGDIVLLHGCCHNPCGADLSPQQWKIVADLIAERGLIPFIDIAYQGFGDSLEQDAYGLRLMADSVPEMFIAASCSKNFGLYRERTGAAIIIANTPLVADIALSQILSATRANYSMPPSHGASIVEEILTSELRILWERELATMHQRISGLRKDLNLALAKRGASQFDFIEQQKGMFSFLGLNEQQVNQLKADFGIYMVGSSRINIAGINQANIDHLADSIIKVL